MQSTAHDSGGSKIFVKKRVREAHPELAKINQPLGYQILNFTNISL
jgi:hypothetical protein